MLNMQHGGVASSGSMGSPKEWWQALEEKTSPTCETCAPHFFVAWNNGVESKLVDSTEFFFVLMDLFWKVTRWLAPFRASGPLTPSTWSWKSSPKIRRLQVMLSHAACVICCMSWRKTTSFRGWCRGMQVWMDSGGASSKLKRWILPLRSS